MRHRLNTRFIYMHFMHMRPKVILYSILNFILRLFVCVCACSCVCMCVCSVHVCECMSVGGGSGECSAEARRWDACFLRAEVTNSYGSPSSWPRNQILVCTQPLSHFSAPSEDFLIIIGMKHVFMVWNLPLMVSCQESERKRHTWKGQCARGLRVSVQLEFSEFRASSV